jgi:tetraacyldisaccharide 4'-kinase
MKNRGLSPPGGPLLAAALAPLSALYGRALEARARLYRSGVLASRRVSCPVVSVGNLTFGGTGKTPFVEFLARRLRFEGRHPAVVSRGYGRRSKGVIVVSRGAGPLVGPDRGGDEPVAISRRIPAMPVVVGEERADAASAALDLGADLILLDDGYQHLALERDVDLLLLDAADPFGGGKLPPAGRLREPLSALGRADAVVFTRAHRAESPSEARSELDRRNPRAPVFTARIRPAGLWDERGSPVMASRLAARRFVAVCGIANPAGFAASLAELDLSPEELLAFPDHHRYARRDLERIRRAADRTGSAWILTTTKDAVKLEGTTSLPVVTLRLDVEVEEAAFFPFLLSRISEGQPKSPRTASAPRP